MGKSTTQPPGPISKGYVLVDPDGLIRAAQQCGIVLDELASSDPSSARMREAVRSAMRDLEAMATGPRGVLAKCRDAATADPLALIVRGASADMNICADVFAQLGALFCVIAGDPGSTKLPPNTRELAKLGQHVAQDWANTADNMRDQLESHLADVAGSAREH